MFCFSKLLFFAEYSTQTCQNRILSSFAAPVSLHVVYQGTDWQHLPQRQGVVSVVRRQLGEIAGQAAKGVLNFQLAEAINVKIVWFVIPESP